MIDEVDRRDRKGKKRGNKRKVHKGELKERNSDRLFVKTVKSEEF